MQTIPTALCTLNPQAQNSTAWWISNELALDSSLGVLVIFYGTMVFPSFRTCCHLSVPDSGMKMPGCSRCGMCQDSLRVWLGIMLAVCPGKHSVAHKLELESLASHTHTQTQHTNFWWVTPSENPPENCNTRLVFGHKSWNFSPPAPGWISWMNE